MKADLKTLRDRVEDALDDLEVPEDEAVRAWGLEPAKRAEVGTQDPLMDGLDD